MTPAGTTGRDTARERIRRLRLAQIRTDSAYEGRLVDRAEDILHPTLKTCAHPKDAKDCVNSPRHRRGGRTRGVLMKARRGIRDDERLPQISEAPIA